MAEVDFVIVTFLLWQSCELAELLSLVVFAQIVKSSNFPAMGFVRVLN